jgi:hypothetical protein
LATAQANLAGLRKESESKVAGAMLGHRIDFKGMDHATKTINDIRKQGVMRQQMKKKQQIERLAAALDN